MTATVPSDRARVRLTLALGLATAGLLALIAAAAMVVALLMRPDWRTLGTVAELQGSEPGLYIVENKEFYLAWIGATPVALSTKDPSGRPCPNPVRWDMHDQFFYDPCGGATYSREGAYVRGPSPRGMDRFATRVTDGCVEVDVTHVTPGERHF